MNRFFDSFPFRISFIRSISFCACLVAVTLTLSQPASASDQIELRTNQSWVESLQRSAPVKFDNAMDAFSLVFSKLPDKVFVFPTENYYYYTFSAHGVIYAGNLRLAAQDRDQGILHFAILKQANAANDSSEIMYKALHAADGVKVEKVSDFAYRVTFKGKVVLFQLNDVSSIVPPKEIVADGERYLGAVFDESGIRFFLFYNARLKVFAYVLDETAPVLDLFMPMEKDSRILIGHRTGFALYRHHHLKRKVLIGVHGGNTVVNNYYDGPADQLPENHIKDDNLRKSIIDSDPNVAGQLDPFGYLNSGEGRYLIVPYTQYLDTSELADYDVCATSKEVGPDRYDGCFISSD